MLLLLQLYTLFVPPENVTGKNFLDTSKWLPKQTANAAFLKWTIYILFYPHCVQWGIMSSPFLLWCEQTPDFRIPKFLVKLWIEVFLHLFYFFLLWLLNFSILTDGILKSVKMSSSWYNSFPSPVTKATLKKKRKSWHHKKTQNYLLQPKWLIKLAVTNNC